jgi:hypothetical protein
MNKKTKLRKDFERICNEYKQALEEKWDLNPKYGYWIADEVGGVYDNDGFVTLNLLEMIYCVENDISWGQYDEWSQYNIKAHEYHFDYINLKSWHMGCPRVPQSTFNRLDSMKAKLDEEIEKQKVKSC